MKRILLTAASSTDVETPRSQRQTRLKVGNSICRRAIARLTSEYRAELEESRRRQEEEERRQQALEVLNNYEQVLVAQLVEDLEQAVENLRRADAIRELLQVAAGAPLPSDKVEAVRAWIDWAARWADDIDPRTNPLRAARVVRPDLNMMSEEEFNYRRDWPSITSSYRTSDEGPAQR
jgi:hypothetical protein